MYSPEKFIQPINVLGLKEDEVLKMDNEAAENLFYDLLKELNGLNSELAESWERKLDDEKIDIQSACIKLKEIIIKRKNIESYGSVKYESGNNQFEIIIEGRRFVIDDARLAQYMPDNLLGNGSVAKVYSLPHDKVAVCVKIVHDYEKYSEGNTIHQEGDFLKKLEKFSVENVRTPHLYNTYNNLGFTFLIMEELNAANFRLVLEGKDELPAKFNLEDYFSKLKKYISALHEKGIYHQDMAIRNLMIDRQTGDPYVIDFGRSVFKEDIIGEKFDELDKIKTEKDWAGFEACHTEAKRKISNKK